MKTEVKAIIYLVGIFVVLSIGYFYGKNSQTNTVEEVVACTQDAFECPDGSFVSRVAPSCEFAMCPAVKNTEAASTTKTFFDAEKRVSFSYEDNFYLNGQLTDFVSPVQWPPEISISTSTYSCKQGTVGNSKTIQKYISGKNYCITTEIEGAAGSTYTTYIYKTLIAKKNVTLTFISRVPQCSNFDDPQKTRCEKEIKDFNIEKVILPVFESIKFEE